LISDLGPRSDTRVTADVYVVASVASASSCRRRALAGSAPETLRSGPGRQRAGDRPHTREDDMGFTPLGKLTVWSICAISVIVAAAIIIEVVLHATA
jgi:hypothetical protein